MPSLAEFSNYVQLPQVKAALDTIAWAEGGRSYNTLFGGGVFSGNQHPNIAITANGYTSTAAGRYQFLSSTWAGVKNALGLPDFGAASQDIGAVYLIWQRGQLSKMLAGDFQGMMQGLGCLWAALPYATCGQTRRPLDQTMNYYNAALAVYGRSANVPANNIGMFAGVSGSEIALLGGVGLLVALLLFD